MVALTILRYDWKKRTSDTERSIGRPCSRARDRRDVHAARAIKVGRKEATAFRTRQFKF